MPYCKKNDNIDQLEVLLGDMLSQSMVDVKIRPLLEFPDFFSECEDYHSINQLVVDSILLYKQYLSTTKDVTTLSENEKERISFVNLLLQQRKNIPSESFLSNLLKDIFGNASEQDFHSFKPSFTISKKNSLDAINYYLRTLEKDDRERQNNLKHALYLPRLDLLKSHKKNTRFFFLKYLVSIFVLNF